MRRKLTMLLACLLLAGCAAQQPVVQEAAAVTGTADNVPAAVANINKTRPGERLELVPHVVAGKITLFDFYSVYCPPCMRIGPALEKLAAARLDIVVRKVDINRPGVQGIDWQSPLAQQYGLDSIPHFKIYDAQGGLMAEGREALAQVQDWLREANISM